MSKKGYKQSEEHTKKINTPERAKKISETLKLRYKLGKQSCWTKGKKLSDEHKNLIKLNAKVGENHKKWKGEEAGYTSKHDWIRKEFGRPKRCEFCGKTDQKKYEWANKDHKYRRKIEDYFRLCTSCHRKYDYENNLSKKSGRKKSLKTKNTSRDNPSPGLNGSCLK